MSNSNVIAIDILLGEDDEGAQLNRDQFLSYFQFAINNLSNQDNKIRYNQYYKELRHLKLKPSEIAMDLLIIASTAFAADTRVRRYATAQDSWTRQFKLLLPVSNVSLWDNHKPLLISILQFLTGDFWDFEFRERVESAAEISPIPVRTGTGLSYETDTVCLFSGGLDSFIGAFDLLRAGIRPLLVGHSKSKDVAQFRNIAYESIKQKFPFLTPSLVRAGVKVDKIEHLTDREDTERGRSFLFLVLGIVTASSLEIRNGSRKKVIIPENGLISINLPLTPLRLGSYSTRTTHPYFLKMMQELVDNLNFQIDLRNPYEHKTKGEMLRDCGDTQFVASVNTMSCSRPATRNAHIEGLGERHCGRCVPCIIRRSALKKAGITDDNSTLPADRKYRLDILSETLRASHNSGENVMAFKYFINKLDKQPSYLTAAIRITGPLNDVNSSLDMYKRGLEEVKDLLNGVQIVD